MEFNVACRTDTELRDKLKPVVERLLGNLDKLWGLFLDPGSENAPSIEMVMNFTLYLFRGMAIQSVLYDDPEHYKELREQWVGLVAPLVKIKGSSAS